MNSFQVYIFLILSTLFPLLLSGQIKMEREYRIRKDTIAENACIFINQSGFLEEKTRVKWYREESKDGNSYEAKFKQNGREFSIEFNMKGELEDADAKHQYCGKNPPHQ
jgi:hypothetical protein